MKHIMLACLCDGLYTSYNTFNVLILIHCEVFCVSSAVLFDTFIKQLTYGTLTLSLQKWPTHSIYNTVCSTTEVTVAVTITEVAKYL